MAFLWFGRGKKKEEAAPEAIAAKLEPFDPSRVKHALKLIASIRGLYDNARREMNGVGHRFGAGIAPSDKNPVIRQLQKAITELRTAGGLENQLITEMAEVEKELKTLSGIKESKDLTKAEQAAIKFCAMIASETNKIVLEIDDLKNFFNQVRLKAKDGGGYQVVNEDDPLELMHIHSKIVSDISAGEKHIQELTNILEQIRIIKLRREQAA